MSTLVLEQPVHTPPSAKEEADVYGWERFLAEVSQYGVISEIQQEDNGAIKFKLTLYNGIEYTGLIPAHCWRREETTDGGIRYREFSDSSFMLNEVTFIALPVPDEEYREQVTPRDFELASNELNKIKREGGVRLGPEVEYSLESVFEREALEDFFTNFLVSVAAVVKSPTSYHQSAFWAEIFAKTPATWRKYILDLVPKDIKELLVYQREFNGTIEIGAEGVARSVKRKMAKRFRKLDRDVLINAASAHPMGRELNMSADGSLRAGDNVVVGKYVEVIARRLVDIMKRYSHLLKPEVKEVWEQITSSYGFDSVDELLFNCPDMSFWLMNSMHVSSNLPVDLEGKTSEILVKSSGNLLKYFRSIMNGLCFSGSASFGVELALKDESDEISQIDDAREIAMGILPMALPANLTPPGKSVLRQGINSILDGEVHILDRAGGRIELNGISMPEAYANTRPRITFNWLQLKSALQINDLGTLGEEIRFENTARPSTPDLEKYELSVAIQEILSVAALISVTEGYADIFKWLESKGFLDDKISQDIYEESTSDATYLECLRSVQGKFNHYKLGMLSKIIDYVSLRLPELGYSCRLAWVGINALLRESFEIFEQERYLNLGGCEKFIFYKKSNIANWGRFLKTLTNEDIAEILREHFGLEKGFINELERPELIAYLNHYYLKEQCLASYHEEA